jgi:transcriptional regulator with XRE-family HTH domain
MTASVEAPGVVLLHGPGPSPAVRLVAELTAARICQGLSLAEVAHRGGFGESSLSHWETGRATPYGDSLAAWAAALGYEIHLQRPPTSALLDDLIGALAGLLDDDATEQGAAAGGRANGQENT